MSSLAPPAIEASSLPTVAVNLLRGVIYRDQTPELWRKLLVTHGPARDYLRVLALTLVIDEAEGYAYVRQVDEADPGDGGDDQPRLIPRRQLSYPVSLLLVLLRKRLAQHDALAGDTRLVLTLEQIVELMRTFLPSSTNDARLTDKIEQHISRVEDLGFLARLKDDENSFEVRRILRAFVDADRLAAWEEVYREHAERLD
ncbi:MAG: DUF4194 domain-containing protein [Burkholderiales bacterium]